MWKAAEIAKRDRDDAWAKRRGAGDEDISSDEDQEPPPGTSDEDDDDEDAATAMVPRVGQRVPVVDLGGPATTNRHSPCYSGTS